MEYGIVRSEDETFIVAKHGSRESRLHRDGMMKSSACLQLVEAETKPLQERIAELEEALQSIYFTAANAAGDGDLSTPDLEGYLRHIAEKVNAVLAKKAGDNE